MYHRDCSCFEAQILFFCIFAEIPIGAHTTLEIIVRTKAAHCPEETKVIKLCRAGRIEVACSGFLRYPMHSDTEYIIYS